MNLSRDDELNIDFQTRTSQRPASPNNRMCSLAEVKIVGQKVLQMRRIFEGQPNHDKTLKLRREIVSTMDQLKKMLHSRYHEAVKRMIHMVSRLLTAVDGSIGHENHERSGLANAENLDCTYLSQCPSQHLTFNTGRSSLGTSVFPGNPTLRPVSPNVCSNLPRADPIHQSSEFGMLPSFQYSSLSHDPPNCRSSSSRAGTYSAINHSVIPRRYPSCSGLVASGNSPQVTSSARKTGISHATGNSDCPSCTRPQSTDMYCPQNPLEGIGTSNHGGRWNAQRNDNTRYEFHFGIQGVLSFKGVGSLTFLEDAPGSF